MAHHRNRLRTPRFRSRSDSGNRAFWRDQMMSLIVSGSDGVVTRETTTITTIQLTHTINVRLSQLSNGASVATRLNSTDSTNQVYGNPKTRTKVAAAGVARRHSTPSRKTTEIGAATHAPTF